mmetsp:Transcript_3363/g.6458  ORF Transcript_3363/g.6458 Transcript_3363/m.6458 type:complete len:486 (-) Transcript_3363:1851-3308(-)
MSGRDGVVGADNDEWIWRNSALSGLEAVEIAMHCPICQGMLEAPCSMKKCGHTFCSVCLKRWVQRYGGCPTCRVKCSVEDFEHNKPLGNVVKAYMNARKDILQVAGLKVPEPKPVIEVATRMSVSLDKGEQKRGVVGRELKKRMPLKVYHLLKDKDIKKLLREAGLPITGTKQVMIRRHKEYTILFNTCLEENDAVTAQQQRDMRRRVLKEEEERNNNKESGMFNRVKAAGTHKQILGKIEMTADFMKGFERLRKEILKRKKKKKSSKKSKKKKLPQKTTCSKGEPGGIERKKLETREKFDLSAPHWQRIMRVNIAVPVYLNSITKEVYIEQTQESLSSSSSQVVPKTEVECLNTGVASQTKLAAHSALVGPLNADVACQTTLPKTVKSANASVAIQATLPPTVTLGTKKIVASGPMEIINLENSNDDSNDALVTRAGWSCTSCTFLNHSDISLACNMCGKDRVGVKRTCGDKKETTRKKRKGLL